MNFRQSKDLKSKSTTTNFVNKNVIADLVRGDFSNSSFTKVNADFEPVRPTILDQNDSSR